MSDYSEHLISMAGGDGDELDAIEARVNAADAAPWRIERHDLSLFVHSADEGLEANLGYVGNRPEANAEFIAHARTDVPALLALVREQRARIAQVEALASRWATLGASHAYYSKRVRHALKVKP